MSEIERKQIQASILEADDEGSFEAVIATLGVADSDGDIVEPGAFGDATVSVLPAHDSRSVPLGKAQIEERGDKAVAVGRFNLDIPAARDWHSALKFDLVHQPAVQEWSWGFHITEAKEDTVDGEPVRRLVELDMLEVSPVLRGASVGTRTLAAKAARCPECGEKITEPQEQDEDPEPEDDELQGLTLHDQMKAAIRGVEDVVARLREVSDQRRKDDREIGSESKVLALELSRGCGDLARVLKQVAAMTDEVMPDDPVVAAASEYMAHIARYGSRH